MLAIPINQDNTPEAVLELLFTLKVKEVMTKPVLTARPTDTLRDIQKLMKSHHITGIPISDDSGNLLGIVSINDIVNALDNGWIEETAEKHMAKKVIVLQESMSLSFCVSYFNKYSFGRFPVLNRDSKLTGIVTASDVISTLLVALNKEVERLEQTTPLTPDPGTVSPESVLDSDMEFKTKPFDFELAGQASTAIKRALKNAGIDPGITRRIAIASYELEINQVVHSVGGVMRYSIHQDRLEIEATDEGPGIPNVENALTEGFSTANDRIRSLGFGAGMGLPNTKRVSDEFYIESVLGKGTRVVASFSLKGTP
ncbi:MAG TPA: CBS domain-containing protein [Treponema sp.]|nr:CBS domain-containing protein [Treponema sp.]